MVGITLSSEEINNAPPEIRRWLEQRVAEAMGVRRSAPRMDQPHHLVACDPDTLRRTLMLFQHVLPIVGVFFELGREPLAVSPQGLRVLAIDDMTRHCRLQSSDQLITCLDAINQALQRVAGDPEALLTVVDSNEHVLVPDSTARGIQAIWQDIVARRQAAEQSALYPADQSQTGGMPAPQTARESMPMATGAETRPGTSAGAGPASGSGGTQSPGQIFQPYAINLVPHIGGSSST
jgi:hypothetical protein